MFTQIAEALRFAWQALRTNLLRTSLSLLGVTVGIFSIILVYTLVDSLERNIRSSMAFLGEDVIYVQKWPWSFGSNYPWWKYMSRPVANQREFRQLQERLGQQADVAIFVTAGGITSKHKSYSKDDTSVQGISWLFDKVSDVRIETGRYFIRQELEYNRPVALIGAEVAYDLFGSQDPIGREITVEGYKFRIIGVLVQQGAGFMGTPTADKNVLVPYGAFTKLFKTGTRGREPIIAVTATEATAGTDLLGEVNGAMRNIRGLRPRNEDNFALNKPEMISSAITQVFATINIAGTIIGGFAILVGGFGIANIMFVSVKERTPLIGIQKALGARQMFILWQFLFEAVLLSLTGGLLGIALVWLLTLIPQDFLEVFVSVGNITTGLSVAALVGVIAGFLPALTASRLDPVVAIRG